MEPYSKNIGINLMFRGYGMVWKQLSTCINGQNWYAAVEAYKED
jgi:hypothetical protein